MKRTFSKKLLALLLVVVMAVALVPAAAFAADEAINIDFTPKDMTGEWKQVTDPIESVSAIFDVNSYWAWKWNWDVQTVETNLDEKDFIKVSITNAEATPQNYVIGYKVTGTDDVLKALYFTLDGPNAAKEEITVPAKTTLNYYVYADAAEITGSEETYNGRKNRWNNRTIVVVKSEDKVTGTYDEDAGFENTNPPHEAGTTYYQLIAPNFKNEKVASVAAVKIHSTNTIRVAGADRFETSLEAAKAFQLAHTSHDLKLFFDWETHKFTIKDVESFAFPNLIFASGYNFPDALSASFLSYATDAPIIMVDEAHQGNVDELIKYLAPAGKVYIMGGVGAVSEAFEKHVDELIGAARVDRIGGADRYETNLNALTKAAGLIAEDPHRMPNDIIIATGENWPDALSASALGKPILLVSGSELTAQQIDFLTLGNLTKAAVRFTSDVDEPADTWFQTPYIVGGIGAVSESIRLQLNGMYSQNTKRLGGSDRYETSAAIASEFFTSAVDTLVVATGKDFPDALCAGPIAKYYSAPICLVAEGNTTSAAKFAGQQHRLIVMGGTGAVSDDVVAALELAK